MKKLILISMVVHVILIAILAPMIKTRMEFDEKEEAQRTEEVKEREKIVKNRIASAEKSRSSTKKTAKLLKKEAEFRKKEEIRKQVKELRKKRDEMVERRDRELDKLREREKADVIQREKAVMKKIVSKVQEHIERADIAASRTDTILGRYPNDDSGALNGILDDIQVAKKIWTDAEIAIGQASPVSPDYLWDFENGAKESLGGRAVSLQQGASIVPRETGGGSELDMTALTALANVGPVSYGKNFTIAASVKIEANGTRNRSS